MSEKIFKIPILIILGLVIILIGLYFIDYTNDNSSNDYMFSCSKDDDCISVKSGCCDCNAGESNTAINRNYLQKWNEKLSDECKDIGCIMVMSNDWTCFAEPKCVNGKCKLILKK